MATPTFGATDHFNIGGPGWGLQSSSRTVDSKRAAYFSHTNNELGSTLYDDVVNATCTYKALANRAGSPAAIPGSIGMKKNDYIITSIKLSTSSNSMATLEVEGHKHTASGASDGTTLRSVAHNISLTKGFGADGIAGITIGGVDVISSVSITIQCDHEEAQDGSGITKAGENHNPRMTLSVSGFGNDADAVTVAGWDITSKKGDTDNNGYKTISIEATKALAFGE